MVYCLPQSRMLRIRRCIVEWQVNDHIEILHSLGDRIQQRPRTLRVKHMDVCKKIEWTTLIYDLLSGRVLSKTIDVEFELAIEVFYAGFGGKLFTEVFNKDGVRFRLVSEFGMCAQEFLDQ